MRSSPALSSRIETFESICIFGENHFEPLTVTVDNFTNFTFKLTSSSTHTFRSEDFINT